MRNLTSNFLGQPLGRFIKLKIDQRAWVSKPIGESLTQTTIRLKERKKCMVNKIMKDVLFKPVLCKEVMSTLPECLNRNGYYVWLGNISPTQYCKTKTC